MGEACLKIVMVNEQYGALGIDLKSLPQEAQEVAKKFAQSYHDGNSYSNSALLFNNFSGLAGLEKSFCKLFQDNSPKKTSIPCSHILADLDEKPEVKFVSVTWQLSNAMLFKETSKQLSDATDSLFAQAEQLLGKIKNCGNTESYNTAKKQLKTLQTEKAERLSKIVAK